MDFFIFCRFITLDFFIFVSLWAHLQRIMKYSIITINYNNRDGLRRTIESVVNQTFRDFEYIIIDGGSTDGSVEVIKEYADRIDYWVSEPDKGIYNAMNKGILQAHGEYLNFMNSGDCFYNKRVLEKVAFNSKEASIIVGQDCYVNKYGESHASTLPHYPSSLFLYVATLPHQSSFFKKDLFEHTLYDERLKIVSDWKFYIQQIILRGASIEYCHAIICLREPDGICDHQPDRMFHERKQVLKELYPNGIQKDYDILCLMDSTSVDRLLQLCKNEKTRIFLTSAIKIIFHIYKLLTI